MPELSAQYGNNEAELGEGERGLAGRRTEATRRRVRYDSTAVEASVACR